MSPRPTREKRAPSYHGEYVVPTSRQSSIPTSAPIIPTSPLRELKPSDREGSSSLSPINSSRESSPVQETKPALERRVSASGIGFTKAGVEKKKTGRKPGGAVAKVKVTVDEKAEAEQPAATGRGRRASRVKQESAEPPIPVIPVIKKEPKEKKRKELKEDSVISTPTPPIEPIEPPRKKPRTNYLPPPVFIPKIVEPIPEPPPIKKAVPKPMVNMSDAASRNALLFGTPLPSTSNAKTGLPSFARKKEIKKPIVVGKPAIPLLTKEELEKKLLLRRASEKQALLDMEKNSFDLLEQATIMGEFEGELRNHVRSLHAIGAKDGGPVLPRLTVFGSVFSLYPRPDREQSP